MDDRQNLSQPESVITTTEKSPSRNLQKKTCTAGVSDRSISSAPTSGSRLASDRRRVAESALNRVIESVQVLTLKQIHGATRTS
jgi:hypothetical protein